MKNLVFVIWMLGYPLVISIGDYLSSFSPKENYSQPVIILAALTVVIIWGYVGWLLYEKD